MLQVCRDCNGKVSSRAAACPHCGAPMVKPTVARRTIQPAPHKKTIPFFILVGFCLLCVGIAVYVINKKRSETRSRQLYQESVRRVEEARLEIENKNAKRDAKHKKIMELISKKYEMPHEDWKNLCLYSKVKLCGICLGNSSTLKRDCIRCSGRGIDPEQD